jgi:agmatine deiminase
MLLTPAEWESGWSYGVAWPSREIVWQPWMLDAEREVSALVQILAMYADVYVICRDEDQARVRGLLPSSVAIHTWPIDDGWLRDNGPISVRVNGHHRLVDFEFNSWGSRFVPYSGDNSVGELLSSVTGVERVRVPFVLEGGAVSFNGRGTALVVEECVLSLSRNGRTSKGRFEDVLHQHLGIRKVIWLPYGLIEDLKNTDGHVDNVAVFVDEARVLVQQVEPTNPNYTRLRDNYRVLVGARNADGEPIEVETVSVLPYARMPDGTEQPCPYINFVVVPGAILVPSVRSGLDEAARSVFGGIFPGRRIEFVESLALTYGGGGPHCVTLNMWGGPLDQVL